LKGKSSIACDWLLELHKVNFYRTVFLSTIIFPAVTAIHGNKVQPNRYFQSGAMPVEKISAKNISGAYGTYVLSEKLSCTKEENSCHGARGEAGRTCHFFCPPCSQHDDYA
jgi:hypothetical protein